MEMQGGTRPLNLARTGRPGRERIRAWNAQSSLLFERDILRREWSKDLGGRLGYLERMFQRKLIAGPMCHVPRVVAKHPQVHIDRAWNKLLRYCGLQRRCRRPALSATKCQDSSQRETTCGKSRSHKRVATSVIGARSQRTVETCTLNKQSLTSDARFSRETVESTAHLICIHQYCTSQNWLVKPGPLRSSSKTSVPLNRGGRTLCH